MPVKSGALERQIPAFGSAFTLTGVSMGTSD
jgi:hypothetical protein